MTWNEIAVATCRITSRNCENAKLFIERIRRMREYLNKCPHRYEADAER